MEFEGEAVGEQLLHHDAELLVVGYAVLVGDAGDVEAVLVHPVGAVDYLLRMDVVGEGEEVGERAVPDGEVATLQGELLHAGGAGVVGLMATTSKAGSASGAMSLGGGGGAGDLPGGLFGGTDESEWDRLGALGPGAGDGVAVGAQGSYIGEIERVD